VDLDRAGGERAALKVVDGGRSGIQRQGERLGDGVQSGALNEMAAAGDADLLELSGGEGAAGGVDGAAAAREDSDVDCAAEGCQAAELIEGSLADVADADLCPGAGPAEHAVFPEVVGSDSARIAADNEQVAEGMGAAGMVEDPDAVEAGANER